MKILLLGEYSGVYTELNKGFLAAGHDTYMINNGDGYKGYPSDLIINFSRSNSNFFYRLLEAVLFRLGCDGLYRLKKNWKSIKPHLSGYDVVLLINPIVDDRIGSFANYLILKYVFNNNKAVYLSVLGDDYYVGKYFSENNLQNGFYKAHFKDFFKPSWCFKYRFCLGYKFENDYVVKHVKAILPGIASYGDSYSFSGKVVDVLPFPLPNNKIGKPFHIDINKPIVIFHGWQKGKESRKGNDIFDRVIQRVVNHYGDERVKYQIVSGVPYSEYIQLFSSCHIFIDQLYAQDKGYNGVLGMAAGKVVFSGFQYDQLSRYAGYDGKEVGIRANKNEDVLYKQFCELIDNPDRMETISRNAIDFVKKHHLTEHVTEQYINVFHLYSDK